MLFKQHTRQNSDEALVSHTRAGKSIDFGDMPMPKDNGAVEIRIIERAREESRLRSSAAPDATEDEVLATSNESSSVVSECKN